MIPVLMHLDTTKDLFARIDEFNVLAPGWLTCKTCPPVPKAQLIHKAFEPTVLGKSIGFGKGQRGTDYLVDVGQAERFNRGWGWPEAWGTWSDGTNATMTLPLPSEEASTLQINANAFVGPKHPRQRITLWVNGISQGLIEVSKGEDNLISIALSEAVKKAGYVQVEFEFMNPVKPKDLGIGDDIRLVTLGIKSAVFR
jgi:hypothetical protein